MGHLGWPWWNWLGASLVAFLLLGGGVLIYRRRGVSQSLETKKITLQEAQELMESWDLESLSLSELVIALSLLMRRVLADWYEDPGLYETHQEFLKRGGLSDVLGEEKARGLQSYLDQLAQIKYQPQARSLFSKEQLIEKSQEILVGLAQLDSSRGALCSPKEIV